MLARTDDSQSRGSGLANTAGRANHDDFLWCEYHSDALSNECDEQPGFENCSEQA